jgi:hypothetical protein
MRPAIADVLLALAVVTVILTGVYVAINYNPGPHSFGMGPVFYYPPLVLLMAWGGFALSLVGLAAMYRIWRRTL